MTRNGIAPAGPPISIVSACGTWEIGPRKDWPESRAARATSGPICMIVGMVFKKASIFSAAAAVIGSTAAAVKSAGSTRAACAFIGISSGKRSAGRANGDGLHLDEQRREHDVGLHGGAGRLMIAKAFLPNFVEQLVIREVVHENRCADDIFQSEAGVAQHGGDIGKGLASLRRHAALDRLPYAIDTGLAGDEHHAT